MKRMYLLSLFTAVILFCPATLAHASERAWDVSPFVSGGRVFVPLRMAAETLSCQTVWDDAAKAATVEKNGAVVRFVLDSDDIQIESGSGTPAEIITMDTRALIRDDRLFLPLRYVAEPLGVRVEWYEDLRRAALYDNEAMAVFTVDSPVVQTIDVMAASAGMSQAFYEVTGQEPALEQKLDWLAHDYAEWSEGFTQYITQWLEDHREQFTPEYIKEVLIRTFEKAKGHIPTQEEAAAWMEETGFPLIIDTKDAVIDFGKYLIEGLKNAQDKKHESRD